MKVREHLTRLVLLAVLPIGALAAVLAWALIANERSILQDSMREVTLAVSHAVDTEVQRSITALQVLALSRALDAGDLADFRAQAEQVKAAHGGWTNVVLFRPDGSRVLGLNVPAGAPPGPPARDLAFIARTVSEKRPQVSNVAIGAESHEPLVFFSVPVTRDGTVRYVLQASMKYDAWTEWLRNRVPAEWVAALDDRNGTIIARSERPEAFVGKQASAAMLRAYAEKQAGIGKARNIEGMEIYAAFHTSPLTGWHSISIVPAALVDAGANRFAVGVIAGLGAILALALLVALRMSAPLAAGIGQLREAIARLGRGEPPAYSPTAIAELDAAGESAEKTGELLRKRADQVTRLQGALAERAETAERANRLKDQFLGMLGHELRNPLAAISNANQYLLGRTQGDDRRMHELIQRQTQHLARLVDDLLDVSALARGKLQLFARPLDLRDTALHVKEELRAAGVLDDHVIDLDVQGAPVEGDPDRLAQAVRNLIENAIKYTASGGRISVRVFTEGDDAVVEVSDQGIGIDADLLPHVFEPFQQAPQGADRGRGGLGLGLAIVRQVVELHGGRVEADSGGTGKGSRFAIRLPLLHAASGAVAAPIARPLTSHPLRVALIEDHVDARTSLRLLLELGHHTVEEAWNGEGGLELLTNGDFDLALVDIGLPGIDGYEVARRARAAGVRCRLVALSGYGQPADRLKGLDSGFDDFLVKPLGDDQLQAALDEAATASRPSNDHDTARAA